MRLNTYDCDGTNVLFYDVANGTGTAQGVTVRGTVTSEVGGTKRVGHITVPATSTRQLRIVATPYNLTFTQDSTGQVLLHDVNYAGCGVIWNERFTVYQGLPANVSLEFCPFDEVNVSTKPAHGRITRKVVGSADPVYLYTADPGYLGPDHFYYECLLDVIKGTVTLTVLPARVAAVPTTPPGAATPLAATGIDPRRPVEVGVALVLLGLLILAASRREFGFSRRRY